MSQDIDLLTMLKAVPDPRQSQGLRHPLAPTLLMIILATMAGSVGYREMGTYLRLNQADLVDCLGLSKNRVPTYGTIRTILQWVDYESFRSIFVTWSQKNLPPESDSGLQVGIDGKSLRSTVTNATNSEQNFVSMITLFCKDLGCIWEVKRLENGKISEMVSVQELLKTLKLKGFLFTFDALHCKKKTVELIIQSENDYLIQVKGNEPNLLKDMQQIAQKTLPLTTHRSQEQQKGRTEFREVNVFEASLQKQTEWAGLQTYIQVINSGTRDAKEYCEFHYYISSWKSDISAHIYAKKVRGHWSIENTNHYQKDVFLREDTNGISNLNAASCIAICNNFVVNVTGMFQLKSIKECHNTLKNKIQKTIEYLRI